MKKIIQVVQKLSPGGIEIMALDLLRFKEKDTDMLIVSLEGSKKKMLDKWPRLAAIEEHLVFLDKQPGVSRVTFIELFRLFKKHRPTTVHTHHIGPLLYGGIAARLAKVPTVIHTEHDAWHLENRRRRAVERLAISLAKPIFVADSRTVQASVSEILPNVTPHVIMNGIDTEKYKPGNKWEARNSLHLPHDAIVIGCAGRLEIEKGQETLIRALSKLPSHYYLALAGSGSQQEQLMELTHSLGLTKRISFLGHTEDMLSFYRALDVFCLASFNEGLPLAPLEAQSCNIPSVLTKVGGTHEAVCPDTGLLVSPGNPLELANAIKRITQNTCSTSAREFVLKNACAKSMAKQYFGLPELA